MAIAFDATAGGTASNTNTVSWSHTCTGSDRILWVSTGLFDATNPVAGIVVTSVTYNGVALTQVGTPLGSGAGVQESVGLWYLVAPATGSNSVVVTASAGGATTFIRGVSMSYTGASQTGIPDSTNSYQSATDSSQEVSTIVVATGCWIVCAAYAAANISSGTGLTTRGTQPASPRLLGADTNGTVGTGSQSVTVNSSAAESLLIRIASFAPTPTTTIKTWNGIARANLKTLNGVASANIKSINGIT